MAVHAAGVPRAEPLRERLGPPHSARRKSKAFKELGYDRSSPSASSWDLTPAVRSAKGEGMPTALCVAALCVAVCVHRTPIAARPIKHMTHTGRLLLSI